jgi:hypothetical protein
MNNQKTNKQTPQKNQVGNQKQQQKNEKAKVWFVLFTNVNFQREKPYQWTDEDHKKLSAGIKTYGNRYQKINEEFLPHIPKKTIQNRCSSDKHPFKEEVRVVMTTTRDSAFEQLDRSLSTPPPKMGKGSRKRKRDEDTPETEECEDEDEVSSVVEEESDDDDDEGSEVEEVNRFPTTNIIQLTTAKPSRITTTNIDNISSPTIFLTEISEPNIFPSPTILESPDNYTFLVRTDLATTVSTEINPRNNTVTFRYTIPPILQSELQLTKAWIHGKCKMVFEAQQIKELTFLFPLGCSLGQATRSDVQTQYGRVSEFVFPKCKSSVFSLEAPMEHHRFEQKL